MKNNENILVAVDPSRGEHPALDRVIHNARLAAIKPVLHLFVAVDRQANSLFKSEFNHFPTLDTINLLVRTIEREGLQCLCELYWLDSWQQGILAMAKRIEADLIALTDHSVISKNIFLADSKWALLRQAQRPVMLVRPTAASSRRKVLAAVNMQAKDEQHQALNRRILSHASAMAAHYGAEYHLVNAYQDSINYPDRAALLRASGANSACVHVQQGAAEIVVANIAQQIEADLVVLGTMARNGVLDSIRGHTSERVLHSLQDYDVLTLN